MNPLFPEKSPSGTGGIILRSLIILVILMMVVFAGLAIIIQTPAVQNYIQKETKNYLESQLGQKVEIKNLRLKWINQFSLRGLLIEDSRKDTLIYIGDLVVNLNMDFNSIIQKDIRFNGIQLEKVRFKNTVYPGDSTSTLSDALQKLNLAASRNAMDTVVNESVPEVTNLFTLPENPWYLGSGPSRNNKVKFDLKTVDLVRIHWTQSTPSTVSNYYLEHGLLNIDKIDLANKILNINELILVKPSVQIHAITPSVTKSSFRWIKDTLSQLFIKKLEISEGQYDKRGVKPESSIWGQVFNHLNTIQVSLDSVTWNKGQLRFSIENLKAQDKNLMGIQSLKVKQALINDHTIQLNGTRLLTRDSEITDSLQLHFYSFAAFDDFTNKVELNLDLDEVQIRLAELLAWMPGMKQNDFLMNHSKSDLEFSGRFSGTINDLKGSQTQIRIGNELTMSSDFDISNISIPGETFLSVRIKMLQTQVQSIKQFLGRSTKFQNFDKLGRLNFTGNFDGFLEDFVAYGVLKTELGQSKLDMRLNSRKGTALARYSGEIELNNFDLGKWSEDPQLGVTSLNATITNGEGLTAATASATLHAVIKNIEYRKYTYTNTQFDGTLNQKLLDGRLIVRDENVDLAFIGKIDFTTPIPAYDFIADINQLDFYKINLSKSPLIVSGSTDISMQGNNLDDMNGTIQIKNAMIETDSSPVLLRELNLRAQQLPDGQQKIAITSDWLNLSLEGEYSILKIWPSLRKQLTAQYPEITRTLNIKELTRGAPDSLPNQKYNFDLTVIEVKAISTLTKQHIAADKPFNIQGAVGSRQNYFLANWNIPHFEWKDFKVYNAVGRLEAKGPVAYTTSYIDSTSKGGFHIPQLVLTADLSYNSMNFTIKTPEVSKYVNNVSLNGVVKLIDSTWNFKLTPSNLSFLDKSWKILENNEINYRKGFINTRNLRFEHEDEMIEFASINNKGLSVKASNFDIDWINKINPLAQWGLKGKLDLTASVSDIFSLTGIRVSGQIDSLYINDTHFGLLDINAFNSNLKQPIQLSVSMLDGARQLLAEGYYDLNGNFSNGVKNNYNFKIIFKDYYLKLFEYLIDDIIDNTQGSLSGSFDIQKIDGKPNFNGKLNIKDGSLKINYLGTNYLIGNQPITLNNTMIDATGVTLKDELGNTGTIQGGIVHGRFKNFSLNAGISSNRFLILKTTKEQNPDYYGTAIGNINARFTGPFNRIDIDVQGSTTRPTILYIPVSQSTEITSDRLVKFRPRVESAPGTRKGPRILAAKGINVDIDLRINNDSEVWLIFDEKRGDILKGRGSGDLQMRFDRTGGISMFGNYEVERGEYLFTLLGVVNKPFVIRQGGTIRWNGDPLTADIDLEADYKGLTSSLINLLPEYENALDNSELRTQSAVDLSMHLYGKLFQPEISFNLEIPNLTGNLRSIVDNKLNLLKSDQNALNQQVLGLMVWGSFLPPNQLVASSGVIGSTINNLSQFVSNQLSILVENALKELVANNEVISGFDFDVNYYNNNNAIDINNLSVFDEVNINLGPRFFEDRLSVGVGANFVNSAIFNRLITPHFEVEYALTKDRRLKIRAYAKKDDINQGQLKDRIGGGLSWRKEFDSIEEFKQSLKKDLEQKGTASDL
ncbi:MAG: translocation/assembly module TamB domain-containing protein [Saprospiraceae bacterium]|nr:translocation/assembly module TamB domain-containing protein [Saprospiraceae bacterium]